MVWWFRCISVLLTLSLGVSFLDGPATAWGHRGHQDASKTQESRKAEAPSSEAPETPPRPDGAPMPGATSLTTLAPQGSETEGLEREALRPLGVLWREQLFAHVHNKIVHFPIALGLMGAVLALLSLRWSQYASATRLLIVLAALWALASYFTGQAQEAAFKGSELEGVLEWHERLGIATTILLWLGVVVIWTPPARRWLWVWALIVLVLIPLTGFLGGILAHA
ncbi:MAG: hypothetical protein NZ742_03160 [Acidobacteria bacterium]|nr:hypothetical protein [Acidobacteriota bacterium]MDW7983952.1 hypothetical protein [Acidobacteriota bacterium]